MNIANLQSMISKLIVFCTLFFSGVADYVVYHLGGRNSAPEKKVMLAVANDQSDQQRHLVMNTSR